MEEIKAISQMEGQEVDPRTEIEVLDIVREDVFNHVTDETTAKPRVRWCNHSSWGDPQGYAYAQVTLDNGSVHYTYASWSTSEGGQIHVSAMHLGTSSFPSMGCSF